MLNLSPKRALVLLVEDNPADVRLFQEAVESHNSGVLLEVVTNGEDALRRLRGEEPYGLARPPDLVILDLNLPKVDGRAVLAAIKGDPNTRRLPVVVLTTSDAPDDVTMAYDLHANCYIRKPNAISEFLDVIARCEVFWLSVARLPSR